MGIYNMQELNEVKPRPELNIRTEMWLEEADEFRIMYVALVEDFLSFVANILM